MLDNTELQELQQLQPDFDLHIATRSAIEKSVGAMLKPEEKVAMVAAFDIRTKTFTYGAVWRNDSGFQLRGELAKKLGEPGIGGSVQVLFSR